jgi:hypothetical protein
VFDEPCFICSKRGVHAHTYAQWDKSVPLFVNGKKVDDIPQEFMGDHGYVERRLKEAEQRYVMQQSSKTVRQQAKASLVYCDSDPSYCLTHHGHGSVPKIPPVPYWPTEPTSERSAAIQRAYERTMQQQYQDWLSREIEATCRPGRTPEWISPQDWTCPDCDVTIMGRPELITHHVENCTKEPPTALCEICGARVRTKTLKNYTPRGKEFSVQVCTRCHNDMLLVPVRWYTKVRDLPDRIMPTSPDVLVLLVVTFGILEILFTIYSGLYR